MVILQYQIIYVRWQNVIFTSGNSQKCKVFVSMEIKWESASLGYAGILPILKIYIAAPNTLPWVPRLGKDWSRCEFVISCCSNTMCYAAGGRKLGTARSPGLELVMLGRSLSKPYLLSRSTTPSPYTCITLNLPPPELGANAPG
jgi:hypothetical protein